MSSTLTKDRRDVLLARARQIEQAWEQHSDDPEALQRAFNSRGVDVPDGHVAGAAITVMSMLADELENGGDA